MPSLEFKQVELDQLSKEELNNTVIIVSNGMTKMAHLPPFADIKLTTNDNKVTLV
ncbi:XtrA/YqaO family protein, partial [Carnobacterium divergens]